LSKGKVFSVHFVKMHMKRRGTAPFIFNTTREVWPTSHSGPLYFRDRTPVPIK